MPRKKRSYEDDLPDDLDLDGEHVDYSVLLAQADKERAQAAVALQQYRVSRDTELRVARINASLTKALCGA